MKRHLLSIFIIISSTSTITPAATINTTFNVTATVTASCQNLSAGALAFGTYDPLSGSTTTGTSTVTVTCTQDAAYTISLNAGTSGSLSTRTMTSGSNTLNYNLYKDASYTTIWGDGTGSSEQLSATGNGTAQSATVYGRIPASQNVGIGSYSDTITVTVDY